MRQQLPALGLEHGGERIDLCVAVDDDPAADGAMMVRLVDIDVGVKIRVGMGAWSVAREIFPLRERHRRGDDLRCSQKVLTDSRGFNSMLGVLRHLERSLEWQRWSRQTTMLQRRLKLLSRNSERWRLVSVLVF